MNEDWFSKYGAFLVSQLQDARPVERRVVSFDGWAPQLNRCHDNCQAYALAHDGVMQVCGWLAFDRRGPEWRQLGIEEPHVLFLMHSVLEDEHGQRFDPTPVAPGTGLYPFLEANLAIEDWISAQAWLIERFGRSALAHPFHLTA